MSKRPRTAHSHLKTVPAFGTPPLRRMTTREAEAATLELVRGMGEGDLIDGLGKLQMLQALDSMRYDWLAVLEANLPATAISSEFARFAAAYANKWGI